jgi:hypothetical protein
MLKAVDDILPPDPGFLTKEVDGRAAGRRRAGLQVHTPELEVDEKKERSLLGSLTACGCVFLIDRSPSLVSRGLFI